MPAGRSTSTRADPASERELLLVRAEAEADRRNFDAAGADARDVLERAMADGDHRHEADARRRLGRLPRCRASSSTRRELDLAIDLARSIGDERRLADTLRARGFAEVFGGSLGDARAYLDGAMEIYHEIGDEQGHAWTHQNLAWVAFQSGDFADAERQLVEANQRFAELGDANGVSWAQGLQAWVMYFQRRFDEAEALAASVEGEAKRLGNSWASLMMQTLLANLRLWTGRLSEAERWPSAPRRASASSTIDTG